MATMRSRTKLRNFENLNPAVAGAVMNRVPTQRGIAIVSPCALPSRPSCFAQLEGALQLLLCAAAAAALAVVVA